MKKLIIAASMLLSLCAENSARADFTLRLQHSDFGISSTYNQVTEFDFEISIAGSLEAGMIYQNPILNQVDYTIRGVLPDPTPSMFPGFLLIRSIDGADFYSLSSDASLQFSVASTADLSDGLQMSELSGDGPILTFNARELNQNPGRYHPPILTLSSDGTGRLANANNMSTFNNPPPPMGSGMQVDVSVGQEYDVNLSFNPNLTIVSAVPEPSHMLLFSGAAVGLFWLRRKRSRKV